MMIYLFYYLCSEELESREQENLQQDLKEFQFARRKLLYDVLTLQMTKVRIDNFHIDVINIFPFFVYIHTNFNIF